MSKKNNVRKRGLIEACVVSPVDEVIEFQFIIHNDFLRKLLKMSEVKGTDLRFKRTMPIKLKIAMVPLKSGEKSRLILDGEGKQIEDFLERLMAGKVKFSKKELKEMGVI